MDGLYTPEGEGDDGIGFSARHIVGPSLILLGQPINYLKPIGALRSKPGSSIASSYLSRQFPKKLSEYALMRKLGVKRLLGTATTGRVAGRLVPYVGWFITAADIGYTLNTAGVRFGGVWWANYYKDYQRNKKYQSIIVQPSK